MKILSISAMSVFAATMLTLSGCAQPEVQKQPSAIKTSKNQALSTILERISNKNPKERYSLSTKDTVFPTSDVDAIDTFDDLSTYLEKEGYIVEIVANKYRIDLPKIVSVTERGKYAGRLSTVPFYPYPGRKLPDVVNDLASQIRYTVTMDADSIVESKMKDAPEAVFKGKTAYDFLGFVEAHYDFHVDINQKSATIDISKYKSKVFEIMESREHIKKETAVFLSSDIELNKAKQIVPENGKLFATATPSVFKKIEKYASEVNVQNAEKAIFSFDGKTSIAGMLKRIAGQKIQTITVAEGDFVPTQDAGVWFEKIGDIDPYLRKTFNKRLVTLSAFDINHDGQDDMVTYAIKDVQGVKIDTPTTIRSFFSKLSAMDGNDYMVDGDGNIPVSKIVIDSPDALKDYLFTTAGITILITDPGKGLPKIVKVD